MQAGADPDNAGAGFFDDTFFGQIVGSTDTTPPNVTMTLPQEGVILGGNATLSADATDDVGVAGVQFKINSQNIGTEDLDAPYDIIFDTKLMPNGNHVLTAVARDTAGNLATSTSVNVLIANGIGGGGLGDLLPPTVSITAPNPNATLSGTGASITADASDDRAMGGVQFKIDGNDLGAEDTTSPFSVTLDTTKYGNGSHVLTALARDEVGNTTLSSNVNVTIYNSKVVDITYCNPGGVPVKMDVYYPTLSTQTPLPAVMFIHGGGWAGGNKTTNVGTTDFARFTKKGYFVASIDYRVFPGYTYPAFYEDAKCAIRHLRANASFYRINPTKIGVWGHSAGANIAAMLGVLDQGVHEGSGGYPGVSSAVQAVALYAPPIDLTITSEFPTAQAEINNAFGALKAEGSPINFVTPGDPPFLLFHGDMDKSIHWMQSQRMHDTLTLNGIPSQFVKVLNASHSLLSSPGTGLTASPTRNQISDQVRAFFDTHIK
jgi:acetyl esterase/lipase